MTSLIIIFFFSFCGSFLIWCSTLSKPHFDVKGLDDDNNTDACNDDMEFLLCFSLKYFHLYECSAHRRKPVSATLHLLFSLHFLAIFWSLHPSMSTCPTIVI